MAFPTIRVKDGDGNLVQVNSIPNPGQTNSDNSVSIIPAALDVVVWPDGSIYADIRAYSTFKLQVNGLSGGDTVQVTTSLDNTGYSTAYCITPDFSTTNSISTNGVYTLVGGAYFKWSKTGSASTPTISYRAFA